MLIECLVRRVGQTPITIGATKYLFMPVYHRGMKSGDPSTSVCDVSAEEHLKYFAKFPQTFREYKEGQSLPAGMTRPVINMSGYSIEKTLSGDGYLVLNKKAKQYAGVDGVWKNGQQGVTAFGTEFAAYQWLKQEVGMSFTDDEGQEASGLAFTPGEDGNGAVHDKQSDKGRTAPNSPAKGRAA